MKNLLRLLSLIATSLLLLPLSLAAGDASAPLRVGVAPVTPPMIFKQGAQLAGLEVDFALALGRELGREVRFVELEWETIIDALNEDKIDIIMSSMSITRARQFRVAFSDPYLRIGQMALVRADEKFRYGLLPKSLADQTIGVRKGTTADLLVQQEFPRAKRKYFKSDAEGAVALGRKKIDLFFDDSTMIWHLASVYEGKGLDAMPLVFSEEMLAWAMRRSDASLQQSVNAFLKKARAGGEMERIMHRWVPRLQ